MNIIATPLKASPLRQRAPKPLLEERWHGEAVTERCAAAQRRRRVSALCTRRDPAGSFRCGNTSQALRASSPQGEPSLSRTKPQSLSLRRGGTRSVTERCAAAQRRRRVSALCTRRDPAASLRCGNTSQALRASSPQGEPSLSRTKPQSLSLRRGGTRSVTERCAAAQRRRRVSALCTRRDPAASLRCGNTSQALRASSPQGEPCPLRQSALCTCRDPAVWQSLSLLYA